MGYYIVDIIGAGSQGSVYKAVQRPADRTVAIKLMQPQFRSDTNLVRRFFREASVAGKIEHPNVVPVIHAGCIGGAYLLVMPFVEGKSLQERIREAGRLEAAAAALADAVKLSHAGGSTGRDTHAPER